MPEHELHVISNGKLAWAELAAIAAEIHPYVTAIHIREKTRSMDENYIGLQFLLDKGIPANRIYMNGFPWIAAAEKLGGLHLPGRSPALPTIKNSCEGVQRIGLSIHSKEEAQLREEEGADYLLYGHIFETRSKEGAEPRKLHQLQNVAGCVSIPVIAIGGITPGRVQSVLDAGASGVAVMSGIWEAADPVAAVLAYKRGLERTEVS
ncbi:thiamine phosphate synthase [Paenibacillus marchantiophytorum]|uniref:Thiamine phosphate synthase n=1 Tax=Paenibacillus marchantiophytorum TaxID=1619310 RepID=A0ABQ2BU00_9BACL|nr:thiamine phosphate synthase [Paenibacillus marchantiophytorum]GGI46749.1 thiamine phosphate synthase [Paenibacillus marchantiophytorum]